MVNEDKPQDGKSTAKRGSRSYSVDLYGGSAALRPANDQLFSPLQQKSTRIFHIESPHF